METHDNQQYNLTDNSFKKRRSMSVSGSVLDIFGGNKTFRKAKQVALGMLRKGEVAEGQAGGMRSDSVDSGFSCASMSSCSSTDTSIEESSAKPGSSRQRSVSIQPGTLASVTEFKTCYSAWLKASAMKSIKNLSELLEEIKSESTEDKENISSLDLLGVRYPDDVENVGIITKIIWNKIQDF